MVVPCYTYISIPNSWIQSNIFTLFPATNWCLRAYQENVSTILTEWLDSQSITTLIWSLHLLYLRISLTTSIKALTFQKHKLNRKSTVKVAATEAVAELKQWESYYLKRKQNHGRRESLHIRYVVATWEALRSLCSQKLIFESSIHLTMCVLSGHNILPACEHIECYTIQIMLETAINRIFGMVNTPHR